MLLHETLHASEPSALDDRTYRAITIIDSPPHGVLVWAGHLHVDAVTRLASEVSATDYVVRQTISFCEWSDVWSYFEGTEYEALSQHLRHKLSEAASIGDERIDHSSP